MSASNSASFPASRARVAVHGATGRMGRAVVRALAEASDLRLVAALGRAGGGSLGVDAGLLAGVAPTGVLVSESDALATQADVVIDFSASEATERLAALAAERGLPLVVGTTGLEPSAREALTRAAARIPIVLAPNTSVGVTVLVHLASLATRLLGEGWDAEIVEMHHRLKRDAPSGTALRIADAVLEERGLSRDALVTGRSGRGEPRSSDEVAVLALRGGDVIGDHTLILAGPGERLELGHKATDRALFARGTLRAARWVMAAKPGLHEMADVLGLR